MSVGIYFLVAFLTLALVLWVPRYRYRKAMSQPFSPERVAILQRNIPVYDNLNADQQASLQSLVKGFLYKKRFVGCADLAITDEIRLTIAGEACLLLLNRANTVYGRLRYIYVYPSAYVAPHTEVGEGGVVSHKMQGRLGESWQNGKVILSWDDVVHGASNFRDGRNVVLHEFAHQLDQESGSANGAPLLEKSTSYRSWAEVLSQEFKELQEDIMRGDQGLLDHYGATNPAEFFAVATETFYEQPEQMANKHPELFAQLSDYYKVDPREWL